MAARTERGLWRLGTLPVVVTVMTGIVAVYMSLVAIGNITDFDTNQAFVQHVLAMDTTFQDPDLMWRAIEDSTAQNVAYIAVIAWEALTALVLLWATLAWLRPRRRRSLDRPRRLSTIGFLMVVLLFGGGFITIGGEWFAMWQSAQWNGLDPALQNLIIAAFGLVLVNMPSPGWEPAAVREAMRVE